MAVEFSLYCVDIPSEDFVPSVAKELGWSVSKDVLSEHSSLFSFKGPMGFIVYSTHFEVDLNINGAAYSFNWVFTYRLSSQVDYAEVKPNVIRFLNKSVQKLGCVAAFGIDVDVLYLFVNQDGETIISGDFWGQEVLTLLDDIPFRKADLMFFSLG
jgi:hypothetical protein